MSVSSTFSLPALPCSNLCFCFIVLFFWLQKRVREEWRIDDRSKRADHDDDRKAKIDHHKQDQLNKQKEGKGHWKGELGSNSEAAVCQIFLACETLLGGWECGRLGWWGLIYVGLLTGLWGKLIRSRRIGRRLRMRSMILRTCRRRRARLWRIITTTRRSEGIGRRGGSG